ncbi:xylulokinase [Halomonas sp. ATCH28]|uniref:Xylulose kinase n=1 Tax=Halomonas gemina TaxID=2945105 RepID=A0ABT0T077_9GAMM|nr:xylulokinase [Halomonas gemina]MCL7940315.1 xylulokinase [Halomonas gemina]
MTDVRTFLGLDVGTSALKGVLVDHEQRLLATASADYPISHPGPGRAEQSPTLWWQALETVMAELRHLSPEALAQVAGIGLSGQMHGLVLQEASGESPRPAILWNDGRADRESRELNRQLPWLGERTGIGAMPSFWPAKLRWLAQHDPAALNEASHLLLPKDQLRWRLSGEWITDRCDASGTQLLDQAERDWCDDLLAELGIDRERLPRLVEGSEVGGILAPSLAARWGLPEGVIIAGGSGDVAAGAVGIGAIDEGDAFLTLGTSSQVFVSTEGYRPRPDQCLHAFSHALPGRWFQMAAMLTGASALDWAAKLTGLSIEQALALAEREPAGPVGVIFLPYLNGERTPHDDPQARGVLFGLTPASGQGEVIRAVLEGIGYSLREAREVIEGAGTPIERLAVIGGGTRSRYWLRLLASIIDRPLVRYRDSETGPAFGAARLARLAVTGEPMATVCQRPPIDEIFEPDPTLVERYAGAYPRYRELYRSLAPLFAQSASEVPASESDSTPITTK